MLPATLHPLEPHLLIEIRGIPDDAWDRSSSDILLAPFCLIEDLAPETRSGRDMYVFRLSVWTANPDGIPRSSELLLPSWDSLALDADPDRVSRFARSLVWFPLSIHVSKTHDYRLPSPPPPPPPTGVDGDDPGSPPVPGPWPRRYEFPPRRSPGAS